MIEKRPTVYAVMQATLEICVQPSSSLETFEQMHKAALREAQDLLQARLGQGVRLIGEVRFSHAVVK